MFPIKNVLKEGDALTPLLVNFALVNSIRRVQVKEDGFKLIGTHQLLVFADDVNILGGRVHTMHENAEPLIVVVRRFD
jgi:hypothetical protein